MAISRRQWRRIKVGFKRSWPLTDEQFKAGDFKPGVAVSFVIESDNPFRVVGGQLQLADPIWVRVTDVERDPDHRGSWRFRFEPEVRA